MRAVRVQVLLETTIFFFFLDPVSLPFITTPPIVALVCHAPADGAQYRGQWQDNVKHGYGLYVFADGTVYDGPFEHDHMVEFDRERGAAPGGIRLDVSDLPGVTPADEAEIVNVILRHITYLKVRLRQCVFGREGVGRELHNCSCFCACPAFARFLGLSLSPALTPLLDS